MHAYGHAHPMDSPYRQMGIPLLEYSLTLLAAPRSNRVSGIRPYLEGGVMHPQEQKTIDWVAILAQAKAGDKNAFLPLEPILKKIASWVASSLVPRRSTLFFDMVDEAPSIIFDALCKSKSLSFENSNLARGWCITVLRNEFKNRLSKTCRPGQRGSGGPNCRTH